ncbi:hypothetical protein ACFPA8_10700 [Streptomyces ovatisporus]|uniref:Integral membrane protein n=1 Tax=Streptomyces ovatisporus TaxID=1128682 RepID=A0ABV9A6P6_9ACTN
MREAETDPHARAPRAWIAPLVATVLTLPAGFFALVFVMLSPMACDSCSEADQSRFDATFGPSFVIFLCGLAVSAVLLLLSWVLPWRQRYAERRVVLAVAAFFCLPFFSALFWGLVDWPS